MAIKSDNPKLQDFCVFFEKLYFINNAVYIAPLYRPSFQTVWYSILIIVSFKLNNKFYSSCSNIFQFFRNFEKCTNLHLHLNA